VAGHVGAEQADSTLREIPMGNGFWRAVRPSELSKGMQLYRAAKDIAVERQCIASGAGKVHVGRRVRHRAASRAVRTTIALARGARRE